MRTNIEIDDELMRKALACSGSKTKKDAVEAGLRLLVELDGQAEIRKVRGKIPFHDDALSDRSGRF